MSFEPEAQNHAAANLAELAKRPKQQGRSIVRTVLFVGVGALAGFLYAHFVGCKTGACPLTSNVYIATLYGAAVGFLVGGA